MKLTLPPNATVPTLVEDEPTGPPGEATLAYYNRKCAEWLLEILQKWRDEFGYKPVVLDPDGYGMKFNSFRTKMYNAKKYAVDHMGDHPEFQLFLSWGVVAANRGRLTLTKRDREMVTGKVIKMTPVSTEAVEKDMVADVVKFIRDAKNGLIESGRELVFQHKFLPADKHAVEALLQKAGQNFTVLSRITDEEIIVMYVSLDDPDVRAFVGV